MENISQINCSDCGFRSNSLFKNCSDNNIKKYLNNKTSSHYQPGDFIVRQNEPYKGVYCIQQGLVKISKATGKDTLTILKFVRGGEIIGLGPFVNHDNYTYSAEVIKDSTACFIPSSDFKQLVKNDPEVNLALMKVLCKKIDFIEERVSDLIRKSTKKRVAELLLGLYEYNGAKDKKLKDFDYDDLANISGTTKNYFNKVISKLNKENIIYSHNRHIEIKSPEKLRAIAED